MESKNYINMLKSKNRAALYVAMRQALCYYLYESNVPCVIIHKVMHCTRANVYNSIKQAKDMLEVGDHIMKSAYHEISEHKIRVKPCTVDGEILSKHVGYKMVIDNIIF